MRAISKIARLELSVMFYSPIAWLLLVVFTVMTGRIFFLWLGMALSQQDVGHGGLRPLTEMLFAGNFGVLQNVQNDLFLYIPLLTMGLISRELHSGSMKLLMSSPVRISEIVLGKYLAMMVYCLLLALVLTAIMFAAGLAVESLDYPAVICGIVGIYLLACSYSAIGLFLSTLTPYQVVAAISTFAVFGALIFLGNMGQSIPVVRDLLYWLSIHGRADDFREGLISTKHVFYFLSVIVLFLSFSVLKLSQGRKAESRSVKAGKYVAVSAAVFLFGYVTSLPALTGYLDMTRIKSQTLTDASVEIIEQVEGPWKITSYVNILDAFAAHGMPEGWNFDYDRYERYLRYNPELEMDYVFYYATSTNEELYRANPGKSDEALARQAAKQWGLDFDKILSPAEIEKIIDLEPEQYRFVRYVEWHEKSAPIRLYKDTYRLPFEEHRSAALKRLLIGARKVAVLTGHGERSAYRKGSRDYQKTLTEVSYRGALISHGFEFVELSPDGAVPDDIDVLLIAGPDTAYTEAELQEIENYIATGGNLIVAGEPGKLEILNRLVEKLGVRFEPGQVFQDHEDFPADMIHARYSDLAAQYAFEPARFQEDDPVILTGAVALTLLEGGPFEAAPILVANRNTAWGGAGAAPSFDETAHAPANDRLTSDTLAYALTRTLSGKEQRIIVIGDADFMSLAELSRERSDLPTNNEAFVADLFRWMSDGHYPVDTTRADFPDKTVLTDQTGIMWLKVVFFGLIPLILTVFATTLLIRRRRR